MNPEFWLYGCNTWADFILLHRDLSIFVLTPDKYVRCRLHYICVCNIVYVTYLTHIMQKTSCKSKCSYRQGTKVNWFYRNIFHIYFCILCLLLWLPKAWWCNSKRTTVGHWSTYRGCHIRLKYLIELFGFSQFQSYLDRQKIQIRWKEGVADVGNDLNWKEWRLQE